MPCAPQFTAPANGLKLLVQEPFGLHTTLIVPPDLLPDPELLVPHPATATTRAATDSTRTRVRAIRDSISDLLHWMERPSWDSRGIRVGFAWDSHGTRVDLHPDARPQTVGRAAHYWARRQKKTSGPVAGFSQTLINCHTVLARPR